MRSPFRSSLICLALAVSPGVAMAQEQAAPAPSAQPAPAEAPAESPAPASPARPGADDPCKALTPPTTGNAFYDELLAEGRISGLTRAVQRRVGGCNVRVVRFGDQWVESPTGPQPAPRAP